MPGYNPARAAAARGGGALVEIRTTEDLQRLGKRLRDAGRGDLRRVVLSRMRAEAKPVLPEVRENARSTLPSRGGLAELIAGSRMGIRTRLSASSVGVRVVASNPHDIRQLNAGRLRHPLFGDREHWYTQQVQPGWFDRPLEERAPAMRRSITEALDEVARRLTLRGL